MGKRRNPPRPKPPPRRPDKAAKERLRLLLKEWDDSGRIKTSAYYRLQSQLEGGNDEAG